MLVLVTFDLGTHDDSDRHRKIESYSPLGTREKKTLNRTSQDAFVFALMLVKVWFGLHR